MNNKFNEIEQNDDDKFKNSNLMNFTKSFTGSFNNKSNSSLPITDDVEKIDIMTDELNNDNVIDLNNNIESETNFNDNNSVQNHFDIFSKGYVQPENKISVNIMPENIMLENIMPENSVTINQIEKKEDSFDENTEIKNKKDSKKIKRRIIIIGLLFELLIIGCLVYFKFFRVVYSEQLNCTSTIYNSTGNYKIKTDKIYYFDKNNNVAKTKNVVLYTFDSSKSYTNFKNDYKDATIKKFKGIKQSYKFSQINLNYKSTTIYDYSALKKNNKVTLTDNVLKLTIPNRQEILLYIQNIDEVIIQSESAGFACTK